MPLSASDIFTSPPSPNGSVELRHDVISAIERSAATVAPTSEMCVVVRTNRRCGYQIVKECFVDIAIRIPRALQVDDHEALGSVKAGLSYKAASRGI